MTRLIQKADRSLGTRQCSRGSAHAVSPPPGEKDRGRWLRGDLRGGGSADADQRGAEGGVSPAAQTGAEDGGGCAEEAPG